MPSNTSIPNGHYSGVPSRSLIRRSTNWAVQVSQENSSDARERTAYAPDTIQFAEAQGYDPYNRVPPRPRYSEHIERHLATILASDSMTSRQILDILADLRNETVVPGRPNAGVVGVVCALRPLVFTSRSITSGDRELIAISLERLNAGEHGADLIRDLSPANINSSEGW